MISFMTEVSTGERMTGEAVIKFNISNLARTHLYRNSIVLATTQYELL